jgi:hypothetical protein
MAQLRSGFASSGTEFGFKNRLQVCTQQEKKPGDSDEHLVEGSEGPVAQVGEPDVLGQGHYDQDDAADD